MNNKPFSKFGRLMMIISRFSMLYFNRNVEKHKLSGQQVGIIHFLNDHNGASQEDIVYHVFLDKATIGRHLKSLEKKNIVIRNISEEDRRVHKVYLTNKGKSMIPEFKKIGRDWTGIMTKDLSDSEIETLEFLLKKVTRNVIEEFEIEDKCKEII